MTEPTQLGDIVKMLQLIMSSHPIFKVIDPVGAGPTAARSRLPDSWKEILEKPPGAGIFVAGKPHIGAEIERRLAEQVSSVSIGLTRDDMVQFLPVLLSEDETLDFMDSSLDTAIREKIPGSIFSM